MLTQHIWESLQVIPGPFPDFWVGPGDEASPHLVSQARPTSAKKGRVWWTAYTSCVPPHCAVRRDKAVFCHMTHYITVWVAIVVLKTAKESWNIFSATAGTVKYFSGSVLTPQPVIQECIIWNLVTSPYCSGAQLVYAVHQTLPFFAEVGLACETSPHPAYHCLQ